MAKRKRRNSIWKNGKEYFWSPKRGRYERWITIGKRRICDAYNGGVQIPRDITLSDCVSLLKEVDELNDEENRRSLRNLLLSIVRSKYGFDFSLYQKPNPDARLIETAERYIDEISLIESKEYQEREVFTRRSIVQQHAKELNEIMVWKRREPDLIKRRNYYSDLEKIDALSPEDADKYMQIKRELFRGQSRLKEIKERNEHIKTERSGNREEVKERLQLLFPNRGGKELLVKTWRQNVQILFAACNQEDIAIQVIEIYNAIGRCYNLRKKGFEQPSVIFDKIPRSKDGNLILGRYKDNTIILNDEIRNNSGLLYKAFVHELGHWLENVVCRRGPYNKQWLKQKQGEFIPIVNEDDKMTAPFDVCPTLCSDDYAQIVYKNGTELVSVAMEEIAFDPETFASRCPEHFNLLLDTLREIL